MTQSRKQLLEQAPHYQRTGAKFSSRPYDIQNLYVSLKQWRILHAVIDCGGYAEAAKSLHLSQSTISYTVAKLQDNLGIALLKIEGRKAVLTPEGRALLERSRQVLKEAIELESYAKNLGHGWGGEVRLVVDHNFPSNVLMRALNRFTHDGASATQVKLQEVAMLQADEVLRDMNVDLVISERVPLGFLGEPLVEIEYLPVAHPKHPLLRLGRDVTAADLAQQTQISIERSSDPSKTHAPDGKRAPRWAMNSFDSVLAAALECLGYAWLPAHRIRNWLEQGALARLPLGDKRAYKTMLYLIHGRPWSPNPATGRLAELLRGVSAGEPPAERLQLN